MDKKEIKQKYEELKPLYERLAENITVALQGFLTNVKLDYFDIETRIKTLESISGKIDIKNYKSPFEEITDICGIRIITYYLSDLEIISNILKNEFDVVEVIDKQEEMEDDRFGYRSFHFIGKIKNSWLQAPNYRGLDELVFEIQFRTVLMHGWAAINHKLSYKKEMDVPKRFRRDLFRMSALIELADVQFERLRQEREDYANKIMIYEEEGEKVSNLSESLNVDILRKILEFYFPERNDSEDDLSSVLQELNHLNIDSDVLVKKIKLAAPYLNEIEKEELNKGIENGLFDKNTELPMWAKTGALRTVLDLTIKEYSENRGLPDFVAETASCWREKLTKMLTSQ